MRICAAALLLFLLPVPADVQAKGSLRGIEDEFRKAIEQVTPATVVCVPRDVPPNEALMSSGVVVTRSGFILSHGHVGLRRREGEREPERLDDIEVRIPDLESGGFSSYAAVVVHRDLQADTALLRILEPPAGGFPGFLAPATSSQIQVGDYGLVMGNAFGMAAEAPPTLTAGVVSSLTLLPEGSSSGRIEWIYTSAAVNNGVSGGPFADIDGRLVGTVSGVLPPRPDEPYQFLGKVVPIDRLRAAYADVPEATEVFGEVESSRSRAKQAEALQQVYRFTARRAYDAVVSIEVSRRTPLNTVVVNPGGRPPKVPMHRYGGSVSGVLLDADGWVVTSMYHLTNTFLLAEPQFAQVLGADGDWEAGLRAVEGTQVHFADGSSAPASVVAWDGRLGIALLKADMEARGAEAPAPTVLEPAPEDTLVPGRMVLAVGNPFGSSPLADPLLTVGVLSKRHDPAGWDAWRGQWQTDAGTTDANCGGAVVDLHGRLVGMLQIWEPSRHGRNSGIGFVVPIQAIVDALPGLKEGRSPTPGYLGVRFREGAEKAVISEVVEGSAADAAGLRIGDEIVRVDGDTCASLGEVVVRLRRRWEGDAVEMEIVRDGRSTDIEARLGPRP